MFTGNQDNPFNPTILQPFAQARATFVYIAARTAGPPDLIPQIEGRLELYRAGQPYREPAR